MGTWFRVALLGLLAACAGGDGDETPRATRPCEAGEPARCGFGEGADAQTDTVLVCDGGTWSEALYCGNGEHCSDDDGRGAVVCTDELDEVIYGEHAGPCAVAGAQSCSFDRDYVLVCEAGQWAIDVNCSTDVATCTFVTSDDDETCTDADGCLLCL